MANTPIHCGAEAVLHRAQHAVAAAGVALEVTAPCRHVFEHPGACDLPFLVTCPTSSTAVRWLSRSAPAPPCTRAAGRPAGADSIRSECMVWMNPRSVPARQDPTSVQDVSTQSRPSAGRVATRGPSGEPEVRPVSKTLPWHRAPSQPIEGAAACSISVDFPIPIAADQGDGPRHHTAAQHPIELGRARWSTGIVRERLRGPATRRHPSGNPGRYRGFSSSRRLELGDQGVPFAASGTLPLPFRRRRSAFWQIKTSLDFAIGLPYSICDLSIAVTTARSPILPAFWIGLCLIACQIWDDSGDSGRGTLGSGLVLR